MLPKTKTNKENKSYDIGDILDGDLKTKSNSISEIDDALKYRVLCNAEKPDNKFIFPSKFMHGHQRSCQQSYLDTNFVYSIKTDSVWCLPCALFISAEKRKTVNEFVNVGCSQWHKITEKIRNHHATGYHKDVVKQVEEFKQSVNII